MTFSPELLIYFNLVNNVNLNKKAVFEIASMKLIILPVIAFLIITLFKLPKELSFLIILQASMPPATSLTTIAKSYGGNSEFIGQATFYIYMISLITIPMCIGLYMYSIS